MLSSRDGSSLMIMGIIGTFVLLSSGAEAFLAASSASRGRTFVGGADGTFAPAVVRPAVATKPALVNGRRGHGGGGGRRDYSLRMVTLEVVDDDTIPETAEFFVDNFWENEVAPSQKRSLIRELVSDYRRRYGARLGKRKLQSMLMVARGNSGQIVGCIAVEVSVCMGERVGVKARGISSNAEGAELRPILANLAVARSERRKGLAKRLVKQCEAASKEWGYDEVLLLVEENNNRARRLYTKLGYKVLFRDTEAKKILPDSYQIRDVPCVNVCMRRDLNANIFSDLFAMIRR